VNNKLKSTPECRCFPLIHQGPFAYVPDVPEGGTLKIEQCELCASAPLGVELAEMVERDVLSIDTNLYTLQMEFCHLTQIQPRLTQMREKTGALLDAAREALKEARRES
jgi:hypothetical protein